MSSHHNRRKRRQHDDIPLLVERHKRDQESYNNSGETWRGRPRTGNFEVDNWPWLSPKFRDAHNKRLQARGLPTIPPPAVDLYVAPQAPLIQKVDERDLQNAAREFMRPRIMLPGDEGFEKR